MNFANNMIERGKRDAARSPAVQQHGTAAYNAFQQGKILTGARCVCVTSVFFFFCFDVVIRKSLRYFIVRAR